MVKGEIERSTMFHQSLWARLYSVTSDVQQRKPLHITTNDVRFGSGLRTGVYFFCLRRPSVYLPPHIFLPQFLRVGFVSVIHIALLAQDRRRVFRRQNYPPGLLVEASNLAYSAPDG